MGKVDFKAIWRDVKAYRQAYVLTAVASFGGMVCVPRLFSLVYSEYRCFNIAVNSIP